MAAARDGSGGANTASVDPCCSTGDHRDSAAAHLSSRASRLEQELNDDPTLQDCCRRDLEQEAKASRQQAALARVDRSARAELARRLGGAVVPPPTAVEKDDDDDDFDDLDLDDDDDASLAALRDLRLSQLKQQQRQQQQQREREKKGEKKNGDEHLGPGRLCEVAASKVFSLAALLSSQQGTATARKGRGLPFIVHLADAGSSAGATLDELLETLAGDYRGSRFARAGGGPSSTLAEARAAVLSAASISPSVAAREGAGGVLAVFRGGELVGAVPVSAFCSGEGGSAGELLEESAVAWMRKCRGLQKVESGAKKTTAKNGDDDGAPSSSSDESDAEDGDEDADPCEVCGRTYFHTHVRPVRSGGGGGNGGGGGESGGNKGSGSD